MVHMKSVFWQEIGRFPNWELWDEAEMGDESLGLQHWGKTFEEH